MFANSAFVVFGAFRVMVMSALTMPGRKQSSFALNGIIGKLRRFI